LSLPSGFPTKTPYVFLFSAMIPKCPAHVPDQMFKLFIITLFRNTLIPC
jgi:hypothetical protein